MQTHALNVLRVWSEMILANAVKLINAWSVKIVQHYVIHVMTLTISLQTKNIAVKRNTAPFAMNLTHVQYVCRSMD